MIRTRSADALLDFITVIAWQILPRIAIPSTWLEGLDDWLPGWVTVLGTILPASSPLCPRRAIHDAGRTGPPRRDVLDPHALVTVGAVAGVRHRIFAGLWVRSFAQPLFHDWIGGRPMLPASGVLSALCAPRDEPRMIEASGETYRACSQCTGQVLSWRLR